MEQSPQSLSVGGHYVPSDMMLTYISQMLMEDDIDDTLSDHPALLQVQQPFAQILSSSCFGSDNGDTGEVSKDLLQDGGGDERTLNLALSKGTHAVRAFLEGMKEAHMLLPRANGFGRGELVNQMVRESSNHNRAKKRYASDDHLEEVRRTSKSMMMIKKPEDICAHEMWGDIMSHGYETYIIRGMEKLRIAMTNEAEKNSRKDSRKVVANVVDIHRILILCAQGVAANDHMRAGELLKQIKQHASETGDVTQRLAQCFAKGLEARLIGMGSQVWQLLMAERVSNVEFLKAHNLYMAACSFNKVVLLFSTMTILQAMVGKRRLHIVDYGMHYGFHWAELLRLLARREGGPPKVKITAIGYPHLRPCPTEQIEETGRRLSKCAHEFGVPFNFHAIRKKWEEVCIEDLDTDAEDVLIVNDHFSFNTLMDESIFFDDPSPKDTVLQNIRKMRPDVFIQSILNTSYGSSYLSRFREALSYYTAMFDMFDAIIPRENLMERPEKYKKYKQWHARSRRAGLRQLPLEPAIVNVLKDKARMCHHKDFLFCEDGQWLLQGWMGRILCAQSAWVAEDAS
ncbi:scarecrow-like protein 33 [Panicum miliaceum]|uniref:Scarecrow-like protein 33 n=1 Tax=Panicum miliaceum TaxID=4540 RepID=A0A3L6T348_PANMI|nr:scarecrow-like protein 33 [Panicum miliaceum]